MNQKFYDENDCSGPRPRVPGKESRKTKMTESSHVDHYRDSPPSYLKWARTLASLLEDRDGVELFKRYVESEGGIDADRLNFYFACEGLKQQSDPDKVKQMVGAIYRFLRKSQLSVPEEIRRAVKAGLKTDGHIGSYIYDQMQHDVERIINETTYPNFLRSDVYIQHVQNMQCGSGLGGIASPGSAGGGGGYVGGVGSSGSNATSTSSSSGTCSAQEYLKRSSTLPTLHEDCELICDDISGSTTAAIGQSESRTPIELPPKLTRDLLLATQNRRLEVRPPGLPFLSLSNPFSYDQNQKTKKNHACRAHGYIVYTASAYTSYNPVSLQDSDRQSMSSGRTDSDNMSVLGMMDGGPYVQRRQSSMESQINRQHLPINKETDTDKVIPRTLRMEGKKQLSPDELFSQLFPKLERIRHQQETTEILDRKLLENENERGNPPPLPVKSKNLADAIREKLMIDDENDQAILDQHVSRVWSDLTPCRSPGTLSPCPGNTNRRRTIGTTTTITTTTTTSSTANNNNDNLSIGYSSSDQRYVDGAISTNIKDNERRRNQGLNIIDYMNSTLSSGSHYSMKHSKSMPEQQHSSSKKLLSNKWPSVNTDSGISLFSADMKTKDQSSRSRTTGPEAGILEEASRRLEDDNRRPRRFTQPYSQPSTSSTLQKQHQEVTTVVFSFCDEEFPYRTKIPGTRPTLKQFKDYLPKKGNFRFFFKTTCEDHDSPVIQEEITNDTDILPLFEGKVMGVVKSFD